MNLRDITTIILGAFAILLLSQFLYSLQSSRKLDKLVKPNMFHEIRSYSTKKGIRVVIEIPEGSTSFYQYNKTTKDFEYIKELSSDLAFPANYGFIPQTYRKNKKGQDVLVFCQETLYTGSVVDAVVLGQIGLADKSRLDTKILAVCMQDILAERNEYRTYNDLDLKGIEKFFRTYKKKVENVKIEVVGFDGKKKAKDSIRAKESRYFAFHGANIKMSSH